MAAKESIKFEIINIQTGASRPCRDNLFESLYKKKKDSNGNPVWRKKSDVKDESLGFIPVKQNTIPTPSNDNAEIQALKDRLDMLEIELANCCKSCCKDIVEKTEVIIKPFDIINEDDLKMWLIENNITFPKTVKKLDSLRNYIPEIYK